MVMRLFAKSETRNNAHFKMAYYVLTGNVLNIC